MNYGSPGSTYIAALTTPLLDPVWVVTRMDDGSKQCFIDWTAVAAIEPKLSAGEVAVCALGRALDGQGAVNTHQALGAISYDLRLLYLRLLNKTVERMAR